MEPGARVAEVARAHGMNANQLFKWRRAYERGELVDSAVSSQALLPVTVSVAEMREAALEQQSAKSGIIQIEFPGRAIISVESGADPGLLRSVLKSLRK
jgi:transposase